MSTKNSQSMKDLQKEANNHLMEYEQAINQIKDLFNSNQESPQFKQQIYVVVNKCEDLSNKIELLMERLMSSDDNDLLEDMIAKQEHCITLQTDTQNYFNKVMTYEQFRKQYFISSQGHQNITPQPQEEKVAIQSQKFQNQPQNPQVAFKQGSNNTSIVNQQQSQQSLIKQENLNQSQQLIHREDKGIQTILTNQEINQQKINIDSFQEQISRNNQEIKQNLNKIESNKVLTLKSDQDIIQFKNQVKQLQDQASINDKEQIQSKKQILSLQDQLDLHNQEKQINNNQFQSIQEQSNLSSQSINQYKHQIEMLQEQITIKNEEIQTLKHQVDSIQKITTQTNQELVQQKIRIDAFQQKSTINIQEIKQYQQQIEILQEQNNSLIQKLNIRDESINHLLISIENYKNQLQQVENHQQNQQEKQDNQNQTTIMQLQNELQKMNNQNGVESNLYKEEKRLIYQKQNLSQIQHQELNTKHQSLITRHEQLQKLVQNQQQEQDFEKQLQLDMLEDQITNLKQQKAQLKQKSDYLEIEMIQMKKHYETAISQLKIYKMKADKQLIQVRDECDKLQVSQKRGEHIFKILGRIFDQIIEQPLQQESRINANISLKQSQNIFQHQGMNDMVRILQKVQLMENLQVHHFPRTYKEVMKINPDIASLIYPNSPIEYYSVHEKLYQKYKGKQLELQYTLYHLDHRLKQSILSDVGILFQDQNVQVIIVSYNGLNPEYKLIIRPYQSIKIEDLKLVSEFVKFKTTNFQLQTFYDQNQPLVIQILILSQEPTQFVNCQMKIRQKILNYLKSNIQQNYSVSFNLPNLTLKEIEYIEDSQDNLIDQWRAENSTIFKSQQFDLENSIDAMNLMKINDAIKQLSSEDQMKAYQIGISDAKCGVKCYWKRFDLHLLLRFIFKPYQKGLIQAKLLTNNITEEYTKNIGILLTDLAQIMSV